MTSNTSIAKAIGWGVAICGTLDISDALIFYRLYSHVAPMRLLQSIASVLIGRSAFTGGAQTALLGLAIHYTIALCWTVLFVLLAQKLPWMSREAVRTGIGYGLLVYAVMNYVVLPLFHAAPRSHVPIVMVNAVLALVLFIGVPIALINRKFAPRW